jgi:apolipoprotein N-acyltransferase
MLAWVALSFFLGCWGLGWKVIPEEKISGRTLSAAVVQGNIPQEKKWKREYREEILSIYAGNYLKRHQNSYPDLIIWPEAATPGFDFKRFTTSQILWFPLSGKQELISLSAVRNILSSIKLLTNRGASGIPLFFFA